MTASVKPGVVAYTDSHGNINVTDTGIWLTHTKLVSPKLAQDVLHDRLAEIMTELNTEDSEPMRVASLQGEAEKFGNPMLTKFQSEGTP
jgi:predicted metalloenzyme YecM